jgi:arylsulfatase A-like enzyme
MNGTHRRDGLLVLGGAGIRPAGEIALADIVDVLPTLLALAGVPVPDGLDGRPLAAVLEDAPRFAADPVEPPGPPRAYDAEDARDVSARLAALGYLEGDA